MLIVDFQSLIYKLILKFWVGDDEADNDDYTKGKGELLYTEIDELVHLEKEIHWGFFKTQVSQSLHTP